jgi:hypothetical protein
MYRDTTALEVHAQIFHESAWCIQALCDSAQIIQQLRRRHSRASFQFFVGDNFSFREQWNNRQEATKAIGRILAHGGSP